MFKGQISAKNLLPHRHFGVWALIAFSTILNILQLGLPIYSMLIFNKVLASGSLATLVLLSTLMILLILVSGVLDWSRSAILGKLAARLDRQHFVRLADDALNKCQNESVTLRDLDNLRGFLTSQMATAVLDAPWSMVFTVAIFLLHPILGLLTVAAICLVGLTSVVGHLSTKDFKANSVIHAREISSRLDENRLNMHAVSAMGLRPGILQSVIETRGKYVSAAVAIHGLQGMIDAVSRGLRSLIQVILLATTAYLIVRQQLQAGAIVAISMLLSRAIGPVERITSGIHTVLLSYQSARRLAFFLKQNTATNRQEAIFSSMTIKGNISIDRVTVAADGRSRPILNIPSLTVAGGEFVVILGSEGAGKSTLARVISGAIKPSTGTVRIDGWDIASVDPQKIGPLVGFLSENVDLTHNTVAKIIARGENPDPEEVLTASELAGVHTAIQQFPLAYETQIGIDHHHVSAGQRQRIGLARAVYRMPRLVVLDEPTAHLEDGGENDVVRLIDTLKRNGSTVFAVSSQASLLKLADRVLVIENGMIRVNGNQRNKIRELVRVRLAAQQEQATSEFMSYDLRN